MAPFHGTVGAAEMGPLVAGSGRKGFPRIENQIHASWGLMTEIRCFSGFLESSFCIEFFFFLKENSATLF